MATASVASREDLILGGNRYRAILRLAMPTVVAMVSQSIVNHIDAFFFSWLPHPEGSNGQAALTPCLIILWAFGGSLSAISVGTQALVARRYAEGRRETAGAVLANGAWFCLIAGAAFSVIGLLILPFLVRLIISVAAEQDIAIHYTRWRLLGVISMSMTMSTKGFFDGIGKTQIHLWAAIIMNVCNVALCWLLIFGNWGAPRLGPVGAGLAALVATWIGLFVMLYFVWLVRDEYRPMRWSNISRGLTWSILKLSIPAALATLTMMIGFALFIKIAGKLDAADAIEAVNGAATTDIIVFLNITFTACMAFGTATATLVGQSLGHKKPEEAQKYGWASVRLGLLIFGVIGLCEGVLFTPQIVAFISHSTAVRAAALTPMHIMGIVTPLIAVAMILSEVLFGAGNTRFVAAAQFVLVFGCLVPGSYVLGLVLHVGLVGVWSAACAYAVGAAIVMGLKFYGGGWKAIRI